MLQYSFSLNFSLLGFQKSLILSFTFNVFLRDSFILLNTSKYKITFCTKIDFDVSDDSSQ